MRWLSFFSVGDRRTSGKSHPQSRTRRLLLLERLEDRRVLTAVQLVVPGRLAGAITAPSSNSWSLVDTTAESDTAEAVVRENWLPNGYVHSVKSRGSIDGASGDPDRSLGLEVLSIIETIPSVYGDFRGGSSATAGTASDSGGDVDKPLKFKIVPEGNDVVGKPVLVIFNAQVGGKNQWFQPGKPSVTIDYSASYNVFRVAGKFFAGSSPLAINEEFGRSADVTLLARIGDTFTITASLSGNSTADGLFTADLDIDIVVSPVFGPDLIARSVAWNETAQAFDFRYARIGDVPAAKAAIYWADGPTWDDRIKLARQESTATSGEFHDRSFAASSLRSRPAGATHMLLVMDPADAINEDETNNVAFVKLPTTDIKLVNTTTKLTTSSINSIDVKYATSGVIAPLTGIKFFVYQSSDRYWQADKDEYQGMGQPTSNENKAVNSLTIALPSPVSLTYGKRFLIVKVNKDKEIVESDYGNNTLFVIPLVPGKYRVGFDSAGKMLVGTGVSENEISGAIKGRISQDTDDFDELDDATFTWKQAGGQFKDEEPTPYLEDDHQVDPALLTPLKELVAIINQAAAEGRFSKSNLFITDAFDEQMEHSQNALHYEGRAIDFAGKGDRANMLTGLMVLGGFRFSYNEVPRKLDAAGKPVVDAKGNPVFNWGLQHVHASHTGASATLSIENLVNALVFGATSEGTNTNGVVVPLINATRAAELKVYLDNALASRKAGNNAEVLVQLKAFSKSIEENLTGFVRQMKSSRSGQDAQKTRIDLLLRWNASDLVKRLGG